MKGLRWQENFDYVVSKDGSGSAELWKFDHANADWDTVEVDLFDEGVNRRNLYRGDIMFDGLDELFLHGGGTAHLVAFDIRSTFVPSIRREPPLSVERPEGECLAT